jgi:hypothetical protein
MLFLRFDARDAAKLVEAAVRTCSTTKEYRVVGLRTLRHDALDV